MIKKILTLNIIILSYLCSFQVSAGSDSQYPASDFEPKIQFQSPEAAKYASSTTHQRANDTKYPAASFQPTIQFQDQDLIKKTSQRQVAKPAPKSKSAATPTASVAPAKKSAIPVNRNLAPAVSTQASAITEALEEEEAESTFGATLFMLLILAVLAYVFKNKLIENAKPDDLGHAHTATGSDLTGVEKYLAKQQPKPVASTNNNGFSAKPTAG